MDVPRHVEGRSILPLLREGAVPERRSFVHSEQPHTSESNPGFHCHTNGQWKYIWFSHSGDEQPFDLAPDPSELHDLSASFSQSKALETWGQRLIEHIWDRKECFVRNGMLEASRPHPGVLSHAVAV